MFPHPTPPERQTDRQTDGRAADRQSAKSLGTQRRFQHTPGQKFLPFPLNPCFVKKGLDNPFHPLESSSQVESWCPGNKFRFLNLKPGDSASAKSIEKTIYFEHSWRPGRNGDSAALNANRKTHLAQRRAILVKVFIKHRTYKGDPLPERSKPEYLNLGDARICRPALKVA